MYCPQCGSQRPANDRFCANCGRGLEGAATPAQPSIQHRWEYKDLEIPLNITVRGLDSYLSPMDLDMLLAFDDIAKADHLILEAVQCAGNDDWQPIESFRWEDIPKDDDSRHRFKWRIVDTEKSFLWGSKHVWLLESVAVRVKRLVS